MKSHCRDATYLYELHQGLLQQIYELRKELANPSCGISKCTEKNASSADHKLEEVRLLRAHTEARIFFLQALDSRARLKAHRIHCWIGRSTSLHKIPLPSSRSTLIRAAVPPTTDHHFNIVELVETVSDQRRARDELRLAAARRKEEMQRNDAQRSQERARLEVLLSTQ